MKKSGTNKITCLVCAFALIIAVTALCARPVYASVGEDCVKILLVGNSLTKYGEHKKGRTVQNHLERMAKASGKDVLVKTIAHGGARLKQYAGMTTPEKNYKDEFLEALGAEDWDYVILQEYSKTPYLEFERDTLPGLKWLKKQIEKKRPKATVLLYMPHGYPYRYKNEAGEKILLSAYDMECYTGAAHARLREQFGIDVIPVGEKFQRVSLLYPEMELLGDDSWHPTKKGYFLAAGCIYYEIFGETPKLKKSVYRKAGLTKKEAKTLMALMGQETESLTVQKDLRVGESFSMEIDGAGAASLEYVSMSPQVAAVTQEGVVTALQRGMAVIVARTRDGQQAYCTVFVDMKKPSGVKATVVKKNKKKMSVRITWNHVEGSTYHVYRSFSKNGYYKLLATVAGSEYTDKSAAKDKTRYYKVIEVDGETACERRASKAVKVVANGKN